MRSLKSRSRRVKRSLPQYDFSLGRGWLTMPDGTRLATTTYLPRARKPGEKFPVLLEILPYRKDDTFYVVDYPTYAYIAKHGYMVVKVDIRGTGASEGQIPPCEYSDQELTDAEEIIRQLAALPESNGKVAMWGVSWSGFNSIQVAMRRPAALKTIIAIHASDDLYHDDLHYLDGVFHIDPYHLYINHELGMPATPAYKLTDDYFSTRFEHKPWLFTYLENQVDGSFWRSHSLREDYGRIEIPVYLIAGLLDGYRSAMVRMFENIVAPVKIEVGPWNHSCPDDGTPGPNYEYMDRMILWMDHWLKGYANKVARMPKRSKEMLAFVRSGHSPDTGISHTPGDWRLAAWPSRESTLSCWYPQPDKKLGKSAKGSSRLDSLAGNPASGIAAGTWWGEPTGNMAGDDAFSLVYDSDPLQAPLVIVGSPKVKLKVRTDTERAVWSVRLEDVGPDGKVALVTGALMNSSQREDRLEPSLVVSGEDYELAFDLHFTTWTFRPGHRIRLAVSNAQFPMAWPAAELITGQVHVACRQTSLVLPVVPESLGRRPRLPKVGKKPVCPDAEKVAFPGGKPKSAKRCTYNPDDGSTTYVSEARWANRIKRRLVTTEGVCSWTTFESKPWLSRYRGKMSTCVISAKRTLKLETTILIKSDKNSFLVTITRVLFENGCRLRRKVWKESFSRQFQ